MIERKKRLLINPECGMAGDMFTSALISAGVPQNSMKKRLQIATRAIGKKAVIKIKKKPIAGIRSIMLKIRIKEMAVSINAAKAFNILQDELKKAEIKNEYYNYAIDAMKILITAESAVHSGNSDFNGIPETHLHEAQDILIDIIGTAYGLQYLNIDMNNIICLSPVRTGGGKIRFSHGELNVPAPATQGIMDKYSIPTLKGPVDKELFTPTGASLLSALKPAYRERSIHKRLTEEYKLSGIGLGTMKIIEPGHKENTLTLFLKDANV